MRRLPTAMFLIAVLVLPAYADSDGSYCVGPGYLAVEFRSFSTPSITGPHVLKILRFDEELGPRWAGEVLVEDFQTHVLTCGTTRIVFEGVGDSRRGLLSYVVEFDSSGWPRITSVSNDPSYVFVPRDGPGARTLGDPRCYTAAECEQGTSFSVARDGQCPSPGPRNPT